MLDSNQLEPMCCMSAFVVVMMTYSFHCKHLAKLTTSQDANFGRAAQGASAASPVRNVSMLRNSILKQVHIYALAEKRTDCWGKVFLKLDHVQLQPKP